jgi:hypothetical protein
MENPKEETHENDTANNPKGIALDNSLLSPNAGTASSSPIV